MHAEAIARLRELCQSLPETTEDRGVGAPAFKVNAKIYAMQHQNQGRPSLWCKAPSGVQDALVASDPERFFVPPYVGHHGWIGLYLDIDVDWSEAAELIEESYRMTAPKRLSKLLDT
ncbi:MAG TPA: MmcQ/YjbR family DNA-binding protein [Thermomicrobiales bacterium]|nr:MmcQ/YjbR family DNA-binding protein [Thermomicrobiales bacterium]